MKNKDRSSSCCNNYLDNPENVFAIFANVLATVLKLVIIATNQLFQFLLLLLLTLRVSNQWLPSLHSLSLQDRKAHV